MSIEYKRMQQRVGTYTQYEQYKDKILPNEFAAVTSGSPDTHDGSALYFKIGTKEPKLIVDEDKLKSELKKLKDEIGTSYSTIGRAYSVTNAVTTSKMGKAEVDLEASAML